MKGRPEPVKVHRPGGGSKESRVGDGQKKFPGMSAFGGGGGHKKGTGADQGKGKSGEPSNLARNILAGDRPRGGSPGVGFWVNGGEDKVIKRKQKKGKKKQGTHFTLGVEVGKEVEKKEDERVV